GARSRALAARRAVRGPLAGRRAEHHGGDRRHHEAREERAPRRVQHPPRPGVRRPSLRDRAWRDRLRRQTRGGFAESGRSPHHWRHAMSAPLPLLPTSVVGSHGKPAWWFLTVKAYEAGEAGPGDLDEMFDDAALTAIRDMTGAGIDVITDGEVRRLDGYVDSYYAIIKGIQPLPVRRKVGPWGYDQQTRYEAVGRIETPPGGLGIVKEFEYLKAHTTRATKATCAGPLTFGSRIHPGKQYKGV